jgi:hypothetical protein
VEGVGEVGKESGLLRGGGEGGSRARADPREPKRKRVDKERAGVREGVGRNPGGRSK